MANPNQGDNRHSNIKICYTLTTRNNINNEETSIDEHNTSSVNPFPIPIKADIAIFWISSGPSVTQVTCEVLTGGSNRN